MQRNDAVTMTRKCLYENGLHGWSVGFQNKKRIMATCFHGSKTIKYSRWYVDLNDSEHIFETVLHEVGHAIVGAGQGHNEIWKAACRKLGLENPMSHVKVTHTPESKYVGSCNCGKIFRRDRLTRWKMYCCSCEGEIIWITRKTGRVHIYAY